MEMSYENALDAIRDLPHSEHPLRRRAVELRQISWLVGAVRAAELREDQVICALRLMDETSARMPCGKCRCKLALLSAMMADGHDSLTAREYRRRASRLDDVRAATLRAIQDELEGCINSVSPGVGWSPPAAAFPLLSPDDMPRVGRVTMPRDLYWVTQYPAPLAGMPDPARFDASPLDILMDRQLGFHHIICLTGRNPAYPLHGFSLAFAEELQDLSGGGIPRDPDRDKSIILHASCCAVEKLRRGEGVIVHCGGGRGRTGTVIACVLRDLGHAVEDVFKYLDAIHRQRGRPGWPESPWQRRVVLEYQGLRR